jgi:hypothetical protein
MIPFPAEMRPCEDLKTQKKMHFFFALFDLRYKKQEAGGGNSILSFYHQYRSLVLASLKKKGDTIVWRNSCVLAEDEELSPTFEEIILANVLCLIDARLMGHIRDKYRQLLGDTKSLMDFQEDILAGVPDFLTEIENSFVSSSGNDSDRPPKLSR